MGVFNDNIKSKTELEQLYDVVGNTIKLNFASMYQYRSGDLYFTSSEMNIFIKNTFKQSFDKFSIYHPWVHFERKDGYILCQLFYSEDPFIYVHKNTKIFIKLKLDIPELFLEL